MKRLIFMALAQDRGMGKVDAQSQKRPHRGATSSIKQWGVWGMMFFGCLASFSSCSNSAVDMGLIPVKSGHAYGYVDSKGSYVIKPQFSSATYFRGDLALVEKNGKKGYINKKGGFEINPIYKNATVFSEGVAITVQAEGAPTVINTAGKALFTLKKATRMHVFCDGRAMYGQYDEKGNIYYGYVDTGGKTVIRPAYQNARNFNEGLAAVTNNEGNWGYINKAGKLEINYQFNNAGYFHNGHAVVSDANGNYGVIDTKGRYVINPQFSFMVADGDRYIIQFPSGNDYGWCDAKGKIIINPQFRKVWPFLGSDLAGVTNSDRSVGYIDKDGKYVINPQFSEGSFFFNNKFACVLSSNKWGFIDKEGHYVVNPQFDEVSIDMIQDLRLENLESELHFVFTDYFDTEAIVEKLRKVITNDKVDGLTFKTPLSTILKKYGRPENAMTHLMGEQTLTGQVEWSEDATYNLFIKGNFFKEVSDGWWGTEHVLVKTATPSAYILQIQLSGRGEGKQESLYKAALEGFGAKYDGSDMMVGRVGNLRLTFMKTYNGIKIKVEDGSKAKKETTVVEARAGESVYKGTINDKYGIVMKLSVDEDNVSGSYYYTSKNKAISLSGTQTGDAISLTETTDGKETGRFVGTMTDNEISGTWMSADGSVTMPFLATRN